MRLSFEIEIDNDAFADGDGQPTADSVACELRRVFMRAHKRLQEDGARAGESLILIDTNGNSVGLLTVEDGDIPPNG